MSDESRPQVTLRVEETRDAVAEGGIAVRWVFPMPGGLLTPLPPGRLLLGRDEEADVTLVGKEISRQHAEIRRQGPLFILRDLSSLNGTYLNGARIGEAPLAVGDLVRLGEWIGVVIRRAAAEQPGAAEAAPDSAYASFAPGLYAGPGLAPALEAARRVAPSTLPTVIEGETGTGKEGLCRALHTWSGRRGPFVAVNCGALPEALAEGELFGYRRGAFTGAERGQPGYFRAADRGTLLLDEIVDLPLPLQVKLLRVLEQREVVPLGESTPVPVDVRVVVATQGPLGDAVRERRFRPDLYARLEGMIIRLPPLRERLEDIAFLAMRLLAEHAGDRPPEVEPRFIERLCLYDWPFNVRELDLLLRQLLVMHSGAQTLKRAHLPARFQAASSAPPSPSPAAEAGAPSRTAAGKRSRDKSDLAALVVALKETRGNVARAAVLAGMTRQRAYRLMEQRSYDDLDEIRAAAAGGSDDDAGAPAGKRA